MFQSQRGLIDEIKNDPEDLHYIIFTNFRRDYIGFQNAIAGGRQL